MTPTRRRWTDGCATDRLTRTIAEHKTRIKALVRQLMPMSPLTGKMTRADMAVLERWADPNLLVKAGPKRVGAVIAKASRGHTTGTDRALEWIDAANAAVELYGDHPAVAFTEIAAEIASEVRLMRATIDELELHATAREAAYAQVDPAGLARSLPGLSDIGGPALIAAMGDPTRFATAKQFRSFTGLTPRASETGDSDRKGQSMSKAGSSLLRTTLVRAADTARKQDPQLARIYYVQMVERGKNHLGALCVVAANLAERAWTVMNRQSPYIVCDIDGTEVTIEAPWDPRRLYLLETRIESWVHKTSRRRVGTRLSRRIRRFVWCARSGLRPARRKGRCCGWPASSAMASSRCGVG